MKKIALITIVLFAVKSHAGPCSSLIAKAKGEYNAQNYEVSYKTSQAAINACKSENIRSAPAHVLAGISKYAQADYKLALKEYKLAEAIDPKSEIIQKNLCATYSMLKDDINSDKYCGINQPQPVVVVVNCHAPNLVEDLKAKWSESFADCKNKPTLTLNFVSPLCPNNAGGKGGGGNHYWVIDRLAEFMNEACVEKPDALARFKTVTIKEAASVEAHSAKDMKTFIEATALVGRWNEDTFLSKAEDIETKLKTDLRKILGVKLQNEMEKNEEENANLNKGYDVYNAKMKAASEKQTALIKQKDKIAGESGAGIAKIWSGQGDPTKKAAAAAEFQKKNDSVLEVLDKQIEAAFKEKEKLNEDYEKSQK